MTNQMLATRIAKDQAQDLIRAAARQRLARNAATGGTASRERAGVASRRLVLAWGRRSRAAWRVAADEV